MLNHTPEVIDKINDSFPNANYEVNIMLQKVIQLVTSMEGAKISCAFTRKNSIRSVLIVGITFTWTND